MKQRCDEINEGDKMVIMLARKRIRDEIKLFLENNRINGIRIRLGDFTEGALLEKLESLKKIVEKERAETSEKVGE